MEILEQRKAYIKQAVMLARDSYAIGAAFSVGEEALDRKDIRILCVPKEDGQSIPAYKKLNYLLSNSEELMPGASEILSRDPGCIKKKYELNEGFILNMYIGGADNLDSMDWWRPLFDGMKLVDSLDSAKRVPEDKLKGEDDAPAPAAEDDDELEDIAPAAEPANDGARFKRREHSEPAEAAEAAAAAVTASTVAAAAVSVPVKETAAAAPINKEEQETDENDEYWNFVSAQLKNARHSIASESFIRANEILNVLRKMLIELICVRNGIESDFETAIDYIECEEKNMLIKTYPTQMNKSGFITALSNITALFDRLA